MLAEQRTHSAKPQTPTSIITQSSEPIRSLLPDGQTHSILSAHAVVKPTKRIARQVVLEIARIEMIGEIENFDTKFCSIFFPHSRKVDVSRYLQIKRSESRIPACAITRADEVSIFVDKRVGKSSSHVEHWRQTSYCHGTPQKINLFERPTVKAIVRFL